MHFVTWLSADRTLSKNSSSSISIYASCFLSSRFVGETLVTLFILVLIIIFVKNNVIMDREEEGERDLESRFRVVGDYSLKNT